MIDRYVKHLSILVEMDFTLSPFVWFRLFPLGPALLPSTAARPETCLGSYHSTHILSLASNSHSFHNDGRNSIGSSNFSMIGDHSTQLIIEINNWWLGPSVLPLANTLLLLWNQCRLWPATRGAGLPPPHSVLTPLLLPSHSHKPGLSHVPRERQLMKPVTFLSSFCSWRKREQRQGQGLSPGGHCEHQVCAWQPLWCLSFWAKGNTHFNSRCSLPQQRHLDLLHPVAYMDVWNIVRDSLYLAHFGNS